MASQGPLELDGARAVVTGGAGFLGSHLCERLLDAGCEVVALDNLTTSTGRNLASTMGHERFRFVEYDVTDYLYVDGTVDFILHFASPASPADYLQMPIQTLKVGSLGTHKALGLARSKDARFLLASTSEVYGDPQVHPQPEDYWGHVNPIGPRGVYDEAKRFAEAMTFAYRTYHDLDVAVARIFNTYGPRMRMDDGRAVPTFIGQALASEPLTVHGDGEQTRSLCYVEDLIDGLMRLLVSGLAGPVNLGGDHEVTINDLAAAVQAAADTQPGIVHVDRPEDDPEVRRPDITRARTKLGWEPRVPLRDGLRKTVDWFRSRRAR